MDSTPTQSEPDRLSMFRALSARGVRFVVIGGVGSFLQGVPLPSFDLDIVAEASETNLESLSLALVDMDAEVLHAGKVRHLAAGEWLRAGSVWNFMTMYGRFDVLFSPGGAGGFDVLIPSATLVDAGDGIEVSVASIPHLIAMKESANRTKDQAALAHLYWLRDRPEGPPTVER